MPMDMPSPLYLSKEEFVYTPSPDTCAPPPSSCLRYQCHVDATRPDGERPARSHGRKPKKQVTFADQRGLSLTRVKVFSQFSDRIDIPPSARVAPSASLATPPAEDELLLDFAQPSSDYLRFRQSLESNGVCLEHCMLGDGTLTGTVKVQNLSFEKSVELRVTFDTWKSHSDVACVYVKDPCPSLHCDTFSFRVALPERLPLHERLEFAVRYLAGRREFWDNNHGCNYRLLRASMKRRQADAAAADFGIHFDRFGSPTCSHGLHPDWPSYAAYDSIGPYY